MKTSAEMKERFDYLYDKMVKSMETKNMKVFGESAKDTFRTLCMTNPTLAEDWLDKLEAICWKHYLSQKEAYNIGKHIINQNGAKGYHWPHDVFVNAVKSLGFPVEKDCIYNSYALCVTANAIYADHANSIAEDIGAKTLSEVKDENMAKSCYKKAIEKLEDVDGMFSVREYFEDYMSDDM